MAGKNFHFPQLTDSLPPVPFIFQPEQPVKTKRKKEKKKKEVKDAGGLSKQSQTTSLPPLPDSIKLPQPATAVAKVKKEEKVILLKEEKEDYTTSIFASHYLKPVSPGPELFIKNGQYWLSGLLLFSFLLFAAAKAFYYRGYGRLVSVFFGNRSIIQLHRGEYPLSGRASLLLSTLFVIVFSLFMHQYFSYYLFDFSTKFQGLKGFTIITLIITGGYLLKIILLKITGYIFKAEAAVSEYVFSLFIFNNMLGIILLPIVILIAYFTAVSLKTLLIIGLSTILLFLISRIIWMAFTGMRSVGISSYYLFLYLCAFEIVPLLVIIKFFINQAGKV